MSIPYDRASSQVVQRLFDDIDVLLFEQETSDSLSKALQVPPPLPYLSRSAPLPLPPHLNGLGHTIRCSSLCVLFAMR